MSPADNEPGTGIAPEAGERVRGLRPGEELIVHASDPGAAHDIPAWCRVHGHEVLACETREDDRVCVRLRVGPGA